MLSSVDKIERRTRNVACCGRESYGSGGLTTTVCVFARTRSWVLDAYHSLLPTAR